MSTELPVVIDRTSPVPLYHQLAQQLTAAVENGVLKPGDPFENEIALAERLQLSRPTVRRAIAEMVSRGLLVRRRGVGTTVANEVIHRRDELTSLFDDLRRQGRVPRTEVMTLETESYDDRAAAALNCSPESPLVLVERVRYADETPIGILRNWLPASLADLTREDLSEHGLYELLRARGVRPAVAHQTIGARSPSSREQRLLKLGKSDPLLTMTRRAYDGSGAAVEFGDHCYRADQYAFDITVYER